MANYLRAPQREAQLLEAAKEVLIRDGYQRLTLRAVASQADVRLSTLQYIFPTSADLLSALETKVMEDYGYTPLQMQDRGLGEELHEAAHWYGRMIEDPAMRELLRTRLITDVSRHPADSPEAASRLLLDGLLTTNLKDLHDRGDETWALPAPQLATICRQSAIGVTHDLLRTGDTTAYHSSADAHINSILMLADPQPKSSAHSPARAA